MDRYLVVESAAKTLRAKIAFGSGVTLQGDENIGEFAAEQFGVKKVVGLLKGLVLGSRNIFRVGSRFHGSDAVAFDKVRYTIVTYDAKFLFWRSIFCGIGQPEGLVD